MVQKPTYEELELQLKQLQQKFDNQIQQEKHRYKTLFDNTGTAICIFGNDGIITLCNKEFENLAGISRQEIEGKKKWSEFVDKEDLQAMQTYHEQRSERTGDPPGEYEFVFITDKGERRNIYLNLGMVSETKERVASLTDITPLKEAKNKLVETNRVLETLIANLPGMAYRCRNIEDWEMLYISEGCRRVTGYEPSTFISSKELGYADIIHPDDQQNVWENVQNSIKENNHFEVEYRIFAADNSVRWIWERGKKVGKDPTGVEYLEGFIMDITERKKAQEAIRESEEKYRVLAETAQDIICIHDLKGTILYLNSAGLNFLSGEKQENIIGKNIFDYLPSEYNVSAQKRKELRIKGYKDKFIYETVFDRDNGKKIPVEVSSSFIKKKDKEEVLLIARDMTKRKEAEQELAEREEKYRGLFETTGTATIVYDQDKIIKMCNKKFEELYGKSRENIIDKIRWTDFVHQEDLVWMKEYHRLRGTGSKKPPTEYEFRFKRANGEIRIVYHSVKFFPDTKERIASFADITQLKEAEKALRISEERLKLAIEGGELGLWDWNIQAGEVFFNHRWANMLGYSLDELPKSAGTWQSLVHTEDWPAVEHELNNHLEGKTDTYSTEHRLRTKKGGYRWILDTGTVVSRSENGKPLRMVGIHKDVTERKEAEIRLKNWSKELEERVQLRTAQLRETNKELESFSYSVSHDLKAPLRAIDGFSKVLEEDYKPQLDEEANRYLNIIRSNTFKMNRLITDLLDFSRLGRKSLELQEIQTKDLVAEIYEELKPDIENQNHEFILKELSSIKADKSMLKIVFTNLISNAFKFSASRKYPVVEIGEINDGEKNIFYVRDNGIGFKMEYANKVFDTFQRLHNEQEYKGSGIGLSLVQRVINKHEGKIWAEAEPSKGATFYFFLSRIENQEKNK